MNSKLDYFVEKLEGFSTNYFKVEPLGSSEATANSIVRFELPPSSIVNFRSIVFNFNAAITSANGYGRLPSYTSTLINNVHLEINGKSITSNHNFYNVLAQAKRIYKDDTNDCPLLNHTELWRKVNPKTGSISDASNKLELESEYSVSFNESILGTIEPEYIDTSLLGRVHLVITLAPNAVCTDASGLNLARGDANGFDDAVTNPNPIYKLTNMYLTLEQGGFSNGVYDSLIKNQMSSNKGLYLPFKNYYHFYNESNTQVAFTCATQSLDRIIVVHHGSGWNVPSGAVSPVGYVEALDSSNPTTENWKFNKIMDYNKELYLSKYIAFRSPVGSVNTSTHQFSINSGLYPQYVARPTDMINITKNSLPLGGKMKNIGFFTFMSEYCSYQVRFNIQGSEERRQISGFNTKNISANMYYNIGNVSNSSPQGISIFCETTATLIVREGQICEVIN